MKWSKLVEGATLRQFCFAIAAVVISLPLMWGLATHNDSGSPPLDGTILLSFGVIGVWVISGVLGAGIGLRFQQRKMMAFLLAIFGGTILGSLACLLVSPLYGQIVQEEMTAGMTHARRLTSPDLEGAFGLFRGRQWGLFSLPTGLLSGWLLVGPVFGSTLETLLMQKANRRPKW